MAIFVTDLGQHHIMRVPFDQSSDEAVTRACNQVSFPPPTHALHVLRRSGRHVSEIANPKLVGRLSFEFAVLFVIWAWLSGIWVCRDDLLAANNAL